MADLGTDKRMVRIRLIGELGLVEPMAEDLVGYLEGKGLLVLEWTKPFPCLPPDLGKVKIFVSARKG
jgi:hypothetical protein